MSEEKIVWKTNQENQFKSFEKQGSMALERAKIEAQQQIAEQLKTHNEIMIEQNEFLRDMSATLAKIHKELENILIRMNTPQ